MLLPRPMASHFYPHCAHLVLLALDRKSSLKAIVSSNCPVGSQYTLNDQKRYLATVINLLAWKDALQEVVTASGTLEGDKEVSKAMAQAWKKYVEVQKGAQRGRKDSSNHLTTPNAEASKLLLLLLVHDLLCSRAKRISSTPTWPPHRSVAAHRPRLQAELVKLQLKRRKSKPEELRSDYQEANEGGPWSRGRWVRVNARKATQKELVDWLESRGYTQCHDESFEDGQKVKRFIIPPRESHPANLILLPISATADIVASELYKEGKVILQDAASCWPAHLLLRNAAGPLHVLDATAAPGNKTSHLSALLAEGSSSSAKARVTAFERDTQRYKTLCSQLKRFGCMAGGSGLVTPLQADFLSLDPSSSSPNAREVSLADVTHMLLDPSCSGSGITSRLDWLTARNDAASAENDEVDEAGGDENGRLERLAALQLSMILHAFRSYPRLGRLVYSTCSVHRIEDEDVVAKALAAKEATGVSKDGRRYRWTLAAREDCLPAWPWRGEEPGDGQGMMRAYPSAEIAPPETEGEGKRVHIYRTNGFFAACLVKVWEGEARGQEVVSETPSSSTAADRKKRKKQRQKAAKQAKRVRGDDDGVGDGGEDEEEWAGCSDA